MNVARTPPVLCPPANRAAHTKRLTTSMPARSLLAAWVSAFSFPSNNARPDSQDCYPHREKLIFLQYEFDCPTCVPTGKSIPDRRIHEHLLHLLAILYRTIGELPHDAIVILIDAPTIVSRNVVLVTMDPKRCDHRIATPDSKPRRRPIQRMFGKIHGVIFFSGTKLPGVKSRWPIKLDQIVVNP